MNTEPFTPKQAAIVRQAMGFGAILVDWLHVDYSRGAGLLEQNSKCFWLQSGQRVTCVLARDGGWTFVVGKNPDPELPPSVYPINQFYTFKCLKPECDKLVDRQKNLSGCCCKAHMNYECTHPDCVAKAAKKGWKKYTHPYGSKIAKEHLSYRKETE